MKINLLKGNRDGTKKGRGLMQRIKETWNERYNDKPNDSAMFER